MPPRRARMPLDGINQNAFQGPPIPVQYTSPVAVYQRQELPLSIIASILSYIDDAADLALLTRTSRMFYYMTLPRLYETVVLRSYSEIRCRASGHPEGYGSGSPFSMGLNGLVSKNLAEYVRSWRLVGDWRESDIDDFSRGRVPDNSMMLNIAVRAALGRMGKLQAFAWELNTKPLQTVYEGLQACSTLADLTLRFPSTRVPRPTVVVPPLPGLRVFKALDIDPLCYPDDISLLLAHSKGLESLHMHWSPRMRDAGEESTSLGVYFGRCMANKQPLKLKSYSMINLYTRATSIDLDELIDVEVLEEVSFINCSTQNAITVFIDDTWRLFEPQKLPKHLKMMRGDVLDTGQASMIARLASLERLYIVNARPQMSMSPAGSNTPNNYATSPDGMFLGPMPEGPASRLPFAASQQRAGVGSGIADTPAGRSGATAVAGDYLAAITRQLGHTLRHLLLSDEWLLEGSVLLRLGRACPRLTQLGVALEDPDPVGLRELLRELPDLRALRILVRAELATAVQHAVAASLHERVLAFELRHAEWDSVTFLGIGDLVFRCGGVRRVVPGPPPDASVSGRRGSASTTAGSSPALGEALDLRRVVERVDKETVKDVEIWKMDCMDIVT